MKAPGPEVAQFCEGCPAQCTFVGQVTAAAANVTVEIDRETSIYAKDHEYVRTELTFVDEDGGHSEAVSALMRFDEVRSAGLDITIENHKVTNPKPVKKSLEQATKDAAPTLVNRIGRCAHAGDDKSGVRYCPAMSSESSTRHERVFTKMVKTAIGSRLRLAK